MGNANGALEIRNHPFFEKVSFEHILKKKIKPPFSFPDPINANGFDSKLAQKVPLDSLQDENKLGELYDNFTYQKSLHSFETMRRNIDNSKTFTLDVVEEDE